MKYSIFTIWNLMGYIKSVNWDISEGPDHQIGWIVILSPFTIEYIIKMLFKQNIHNKIIIINLEPENWQFLRWAPDGWSIHFPLSFLLDSKIIIKKNSKNLLKINIQNWKHCDNSSCYIALAGLTCDPFSCVVNTLWNAKM